MVRQPTPRRAAGLQRPELIRGESRDPRFGRSCGCSVDPGLRRDDDMADCPAFSVRTAPAMVNRGLALPQPGHPSGLRREAAGERDAGHPMAACGDENLDQALGGRCDRQAGGADVRDAVARRIDGAGRRLPGDVGAERIGGAEPGALADQHAGQIGAEQPADLVADRDAAALDDRNGADAQVLTREPRRLSRRPARRRGHAPPLPRDRPRPRIAMSIGSGGLAASSARNSGSRRRPRSGRRR